LDTELIVRMAALRGLGDAYHDYRGELKVFSVATKAAVLRTMGCAVDDDAALAKELSELEAARWRNFLPPLAAARAAKIAIDINVAAPDSAAAVLWSVILEDGSRREGATSAAECREIWRGDVQGTWITRRRFELPCDLPPGYHEFEARIADGAAHRCLLIVSPPHCYRPAAILAGR